MQGLKQDERAVKQLLQTLENDLRVNNDTIAAFREAHTPAALSNDLCSPITYLKL